ncbi:poly(3-hydroxybutyrate) depolymerase [Azoarcus sp. TTM-91]|uniref:extracellular catalytic domain type 2 short-chain-length polyhydroxyalkanoate depolymerase n=1 Tax=Azoarcus sp. TTM-91 TaxID=2691581 RepID=UPI00145EA9B7|nr:poly(3-hydroxybutyrate) depolymerase [Azoarcus sp. TTM-91]NMG35836.1 poly(3-hydroxybutyrate) depolymerase [Azoarcus sp. TTM-91]
MKRSAALAWAAAFIVLLPWTGVARADAPDVLPALNIDVADTSLSGLSSGGFLAVQFQVAHADMVKGVGIIAGGPYYCAKGELRRALKECMCADPDPAKCAAESHDADVPGAVQQLQKMAASRLVANPAAIASHRVVILSGAADSVVPAAIADRQLADFYRALGVPPENLQRPALPPATAHQLPTLAAGSDCGKQAPPYIGRCGFDSAGAILQGIYGELRPPAAEKQSNWIAFDQRPYDPRRQRSVLGITGVHFFPSGLDDSGWLYLPDACRAGERCRVHIALHGCRQGQNYELRNEDGGTHGRFGMLYARSTGLAGWAETNRIVLLFPQAKALSPLPYFYAANPMGCWDWWGYSGAGYATRNGVQIQALKAMVEGLSGGKPAQGR